jgi:GNAT superfamily N-acetyltransferase
MKVFPLTPDRWSDFEELFGARGACGGCWCMWWRRKRSEFEKHKGAGNRRAMKKIVESGEVPGLLAYLDGRPVAWCALAPRETYPVLEGSRVLAPVDSRPVWSVVCLFVARPWRRKGVSAQLLRAAARYAFQHGARIVEGYPVEPKKGTIPDAFAWTGLPSAFQTAGFVEVARRSPTRPIMRRQAVQIPQPPMNADKRR